VKKSKGIVGFLMIMAVAFSANATVISVNFSKPGVAGTEMAPTDTAGVIDVAGWVNVNNATPVPNIGGSLVDLAADGGGSFWSRGGETTKLFNGGLRDNKTATGDTYATISDMTAQLAADEASSYNLYVYYKAYSSGGNTGRLGLGALSPLDTLFVGNNSFSEYVVENGTNSPSNYIKYTGLTTNSITMFVEKGANAVYFSGFQIETISDGSSVPTITTFTATPAAVNAGEQVTLAWETTNATSLVIDQGIGDVTGLTFTNIDVFVETDYELIASNAEGSVTSSVLVEMIVGQPNTAFTGALDNDWNKDGNWTNDVPGPDSDATVNGDLAADLGGGSGDAKNLEVGGVIGESGTVSNGSLVLVEALNVATVSNSVGVVDLGSLTVGAQSVVASGIASSGTVDVATLDMNSVKLTMGSGRDSYGRVTTGSASIMDALTMGTASNAVAHFEVLSGDTTHSGNIYTAVGQDSEISMTYPESLLLTGGANFNIGDGNDSAGTLTASSLIFTDKGSDLILCRNGDNSTATFNLGGGKIVMTQTNDFFVGRGVGSSHNLTAADFDITGAIGSFEVGPGTGALTNLFNTTDSVGFLDIRAPFDITAGNTHTVTDLRIGADASGGANMTLTEGAPVSVAHFADSTATVDLDEWISGVATGGTITVASGNNALGSIVATDLLLGNTLLVATGSGSSGTVSVATLDGLGDNSKQVKIVDGGVGSTGTVAVAGNARIDDTWVGSSPEAVGTLTVGGTLTITNGNLYVADGTDSKGTVEVTGASLIREIRVGDAAGAVGTIDLAALTTTAGGLKVGDSAGSTGSATLASLAGSRDLDIGAGTGGINSTGTVTVAGDATIRQLRVAIRDDSKGELTVGGTLTVVKDGNSYFNIGSGDRSHTTVSATTINKIPTNGLSVAKSGAVDAYATVTATDGTLAASKLEVGNGTGSYGLLSIPAGTLNLYDESPTKPGGQVDIGGGANSTGIVEIAIQSFVTNMVNIGTGSNAVGSLTLTGSETLYASELNLGATNSGSFGQGSVTLAGGNLVVTGAVDAATGSYIDVVDQNSAFQWLGRTSTDFEALWAAGALRSNGESVLDGNFAEYFYVNGDTLAETPIGFISIANAVGGVDISWDSTLDQSYNVKTNLNLVFPAWGVYTNVTGNGGNMRVTVPASAGAVFYQVTAPIAP
jgi:hypothetical protein